MGTFYLTPCCTNRTLSHVKHSFTLHSIGHMPGLCRAFIVIYQTRSHWSSCVVDHNRIGSEYTMARHALYASRYVAVYLPRILNSIPLWLLFSSRSLQLYSSMYISTYIYIYVYMCIYIYTMTQVFVLHVPLILQFMFISLFMYVYKCLVYGYDREVWILVMVATPAAGTTGNRQSIEQLTSVTYKYIIELGRYRRCNLWMTYSMKNDLKWFELAWLFQQTKIGVIRWCFQPVLSTTQ